MLTFLQGLSDWALVGIPAILFVITFVVFFHELGHFLVARACGVAIETFSIGFGREIFGWTDKKGTRWKISWLPLGGYVKFLGDENAASTPDRERIANLDEAERRVAFPLKPLWQRALVIVAGPLANFVLAFFVFLLLLSTYGAKTLSTYVGDVVKGSPAAAAGMRAGDKIAAIDGKPIRMFYELQDTVQASNGKTLTLDIERGEQRLVLRVTPGQIDNTDVFGEHLKTLGIGVKHGDDTPENSVYIPVPLARAPYIAAAQCWGIIDISLTYVWRMVSHRADTSQLSGPIGIASRAKSAASYGFYDLLYLTALISVSIGLINLFPIPLLDGGHLLYYACEGVLGRPLGERTQDVGFRIGLVLVIGLFLFATWNDLIRLFGNV
jgi:regulator of sigma E protease